MKPILLITGGASGIGAATAALAASRGYAVCINYRHSQEAAGKLVSRINLCGGMAMAVQGDVGSESDVERIFETVDHEWGTLLGLVNNAGTLEKQGRVDEFNGPRLERVFRTNVLGTFFCSRQAVKRMSTKHGGRGGAIVNVSSAAARLGAAGEYVDYAASKGAVDTLTIGLAAEVAAEGIRVNAVRPAFIDTNIHAAGGEPNRIERLRDIIPMRRGGRPDEVAAAVLWLLSSEASYTTGSFVDIAGGK
ncbi:SDR family oxidoreductase [Haloferula sargassicola]|uniref:Oxidoreductase YgfF n=1 Tax=Haloferula sargassicola TaxID=490096 RepID=A0ABP9UNN6_9BACT